MVTLDRTDVALMRALQKNARLSNKELAGIVGLAPSTTHGRVSRLIDAGVLTGFHAQLDDASAGVALQAMVFLRLSRHVGSTVDTVWKRLIEHREVVHLWYVGGEDDLVLQVAVRDTRHLQEFVTDVLGAQEELARVRTEIIFQHRWAPVPVYVE